MPKKFCLFTSSFCEIQLSEGFLAFRDVFCLSVGQPGWTIEPALLRNFCSWWTVECHLWCSHGKRSNFSTKANFLTIEDTNLAEKGRIVQQKQMMSILRKGKVYFSLKQLFNKTYVKYILEDSLWTVSVWKWGLFGRRGRATIRVFLLKTILTFPWATFLNAHCFKSEAVARQQELHLQMIVWIVPDEI